MLNSKTTQFENALLQLFFKLCPQWERIIKEQINQSDLERTKNLSNWSVYFINNKKTTPLKINAPLPVEVVLGRIELPPNYFVKNINGCSTVLPCTLSILDENAVGIRIYFDEGVISELEIYTLSGKELKEDFLTNNQCLYIIFDNSFIDCS